MGRIIKDATVLTHRYVPPVILYREKEIKELSFRMNKPLSGEPVKNTAIFGLSGTGKTLVSRYLGDKLIKECPDAKVCYVRMKGAHKEFAGINQVTEALMNRQFKGIPTVQIYNRMYSFIKQLDQKYIVFILDEIDNLTQGIDSFLDAFLRPYENYELADKEVSTIFITNKIEFNETLSVGTTSSWNCVDKLVFEKYDANQLRGILSDRGEKGLYKGAYEDSVIPLCAACASQEHGDARQAIEFLGKAAEVAENEGSQTLLEKHVKQAREMIEFEAATNVLKTLTTQPKAVALALVFDLINKERGKTKHAEKPTTTSIHAEYKKIVEILDMEVLSQRRLRDYLVEFENLGLVRNEVIYKGRYGKNLHVELAYPISIVVKVITNDYRFNMYKHLQDLFEEKPRSRQIKLNEAAG